MENSVFETTCPDCSGWDADCTRCEGTGKAGWTRCPTMVSGQVARDLVESYRVFDAQGIMPVPGGWMDQSRVWTAWVRVIRAEIGSIEEERERLRKLRRSGGDRG